MQEARLQKILSQWGVASRRRAETLILDGRVKLNGEIAQLGQKADPHRDAIEVDGQAIQNVDRPQSVYLLLNKPLGVVSTCVDPQGRQTVMDLIPNSTPGIHPVGRLDADSSGALLLTNQGDLTFYLTHPSHHLPKTYEVWVEGFPSPEVLRRWRSGILLEGRRTLPAKVRSLRLGSGKTLLEVVLVEGRNRQIRRVAEQLGHPVLRLHRIAIGSVRLPTGDERPLPSGTCRNLTSQEVDALTSTQINLTSTLNSTWMTAEMKEHSQ
jgi:23S rRNA pseudouridine2605 synthase